MIVQLKPPQSDIFACDQRFRIVVGGRRFGKTYLALVELCRAAWAPGRLVWYVGPNLRQSKRICWRELKKMTRLYWASQPSETELRIELVGGGTICVKGADNYDSLRGDGLDFLVLDEYASIAQEAWTQVLRPALADRQGKALFIGTPQGFNHFHELVESAEGRPDWKVFRFTAAEGDNISAEEIERARHDLDERAFRQEFLATFENLGVGRAYYAFDREHNVREIIRNPGVPLIWALDFNTGPMSSVLLQFVGGNIRILDEMILPDSNTWAACEELLSRTEKWHRNGSPLEICVYGDASGAQHRTSSPGTDWQIVKDFFGRHPDRYRPIFRVPKANPLVKDRVNCVNAMLRNYVGQQRLFVDRKCKGLIQDFEQVCWRNDPHGNTLAYLDKSDPRRTHLSDAVGYYVSREFSMGSVRGEMGGPAIV
jgi:hypothetical protein